LFDSSTAMDRTVPEWRTLATAVKSDAEGTTQPFTTPPEAPGTYIIRDGDKVLMFTNPLNGEQIMFINGKMETFPANSNIVIRAGEGNDEVIVAPGTKVNVTLLGGD